MFFQLLKVSIVSLYVIFVLYGIVLIGSWIVDRNIPLNIYEIAYLTPTTTAGSDYILTIESRRNRFCRMQIEGSIPVNEKQITVSMKTNGLNDEHLDSFVNYLWFMVPRTMTPGIYSLTLDFMFECNPIHHWWPIRIRVGGLKFQVG